MFGAYVSGQTGARLKAMGVKKCLVVIDKGVLDLRIAGEILESLKKEKIQITIYDKVLPEPPDVQCLEVGELLKKGKYDCILAIGGGSAIDTAKAANMIAGIPEEIQDLHEYSVLGNKMKEFYHPYTKFVAIPTTAGTGAEATSSAVITDTVRGNKFSFKNRQCVADLNIVDPMLTIGLPQGQTIMGGLDTLCHIVENLVGTRQSDYTELVLLEALKKVWNWLPVAVEEPNNAEARSQLSWAAHYALCSGGIPNGHAVGHAIGSVYHLIHGHACILVLPTVIRHHAETSETAIRKIAGVIGATGEDAKSLAENVANMIHKRYVDFGVLPLKKVLQAQECPDDRDTFIRKIAPIVLDDFKSREWQPPIHETMEQTNRICGMVYDDE